MIPLPEIYLTATGNDNANFSLVFNKWVNFYLNTEKSTSNIKINAHWYKQDEILFEIEKRRERNKHKLTHWAQANNRDAFESWLNNKSQELEKTDINSILSVFDRITDVQNFPSLIAELGEKKIEEFIRLKEVFEKQRAKLALSVTLKKKRDEFVLSMLRKKGFFVTLLVCKVSDALVCGIGDEHPLENSLRFDHCTGLPYIPSSSIKGVAKFAAEFDEKTDERIKDKETEIFGTQDQVGKVQFWDGFPVGVPALKIDITNNHFQDYYSDIKGQTAPSDDMNPNPVPFIVVDSDSEFYFPVVAPDQDTLQQAVKFLKEALEEWGIGAKSSVGYGMFYGFREETIVPPPPKPQEFSPRDKAFENLKKIVNPENFVSFLLTLKEEDEDWLKAQNLFHINNFNIGFADKFLEAETLPLKLKKIFAQQFISKIDVKKAEKRAEKGDKKDLERLEKLRKINND